jgi:hypothetical protein
LVYLIQVPQKEYSITCRNSTECKASFNLVCSTSNNQCLCPNAFSEYRCDCVFSKYYDPTLGCCKFSQLLLDLGIHWWTCALSKPSDVWSNVQSNLYVHRKYQFDMLEQHLYVFVRGLLEWIGLRYKLSFCRLND